MNTRTPSNGTTEDHEQAIRPGPPFHLPMSQEALEALPFPLSFYTRDGLYVGANELVEQLFRVPKSAVVGVFNILTDPSSQNNGTHAIFQAAVAGQRGQASLIYYDFSFPGTQIGWAAGSRQPICPFTMLRGA